MTSIADQIKIHVLGAKYNGYAYSYLSRAQPLDLLLFHGGDTFSDGIRALSKINTGNGDFSHAGMVVTHDILPYVTELQKGKLYIWEATMSYPLLGMTDGVPDVESGKGRFGIQIRDLEEVVKAYVGNSDKTAMAWCKLLRNPWLRQVSDSKSTWQARQKQIIQKMRQLHDRIGRDGFERNPVDILGVLLPFTRPVRDLINRAIIGGVDSISWLGDELDDTHSDPEYHIEILRKAMNRDPAVAKAIRIVARKESKSIGSSSASSSSAIPPDLGTATIVEYEECRRRKWWQRPRESDVLRTESKEAKAIEKETEKAAKAEHKFLKEVAKTEVLSQSKAEQKFCKEAARIEAATSKINACDTLAGGEVYSSSECISEVPIGFIALDRPSSRWLFCSEMVAAIYIELGIMSKDVNPADVLPIHMVVDGPAKVADTPILIFPQSK
jgi:hypothetical protein